MNKTFLLTFCLLFASFTGCVDNSEDNDDLTSEIEKLTEDNKDLNELLDNQTKENEDLNEQLANQTGNNDALISDICTLLLSKWRISSQRKRLGH